MGNIVPRAGIESTSLAFQTSVLTITPPRLPDVITIPTNTCLNGSLPERQFHNLLSKLINLAKAKNDQINYHFYTHTHCREVSVLTLFVYAALHRRTVGTALTSHPDQSISTNAICDT